MRENWKYSYFSEVYPIVMGKTPARADISLWDKKKETHNLWVSIADISVNEGKYILDTEEYVSKKAATKMRIVSKGSLLMSFKLTIGKMAFAGDDLFTNEAIIAIPDNGKYNLRFLYYYLSNYNWSTLTDGAEKVKGKTLNKTSIGKILLPILSLSEQERIVALLDDQFAKIDALKATAASQLQAAKDFFQAALKEMLTPKEGWEEKELKDICTSIKDGDWIERKDQSISGIRLLQTGNIGVGIYKDKSDSPHYISLDTFNRLHCEEVFEGDILLSRLPEPVGRACLVPKMEGRFITAVDCSIIKLNTDKISPEYFIFYTQTNAYFKNISSLCTGTTRQRISRKRLEEVTISFPSLPEQERIAARLDAISEKVKALQANYDQTITLCNDLKQALLKSIFA